MYVVELSFYRERLNRLRFLNGIAHKIIKLLRRHFQIKLKNFLLKINLNTLKKYKLEKMKIIEYLISN